MKKMVIITSLIGSGILLTCFALYWNYFSIPSSFPESKPLKKELNDSYPEASVGKIQGAFSIDKRNVFVPFITSANKYGFSCWTWNKHKWELIAISTIGEPYLWKVNERDPSTYRFIWNISPNDHIRSMRLFIMQDRGYQVSNGVEHYNPKIQMEKNIFIKNESYGYMKIPKKWATLIRSYNKIESEIQPDLFMIHFFPQTSIYFGWKPYEEKRKDPKLNNSMDGTGFGRYGSELENIRFMSDEDIE